MKTILKTANAAAAMSRYRWSIATEADREQVRENGRKGGRPRLPDRCPCGAMTMTRAKQRNHKCSAPKTAPAKKARKII